MTIFTSICANYLHKARTLADSIKDHLPNARFIVCLLENELNPTYEYQRFDRIVLAKDSWEGNFDRFVFKHSIVEASTSVKGQFFRFLYSEYPDENAFIYLDPDIYIYDDFIELSDLLRERPIVLCPHLLVPGNIDMELSSTAHGVYNLGFLAVNASHEAKTFIDWWAERLYLFCYNDISRGIFTDQKWVDLAPCLFDVEIFKHHGYDFAPWSLLNSKIVLNEGKYFINGDPLRFIHFSGYGKVAEKCMADWLPSDDHLFKHLYGEYSNLHDKNNSDGISNTPWSYDFYESGERVDPAIREAYRKNYEVMFAQENPFLLSNQHFKKALREDSKSTLVHYIRRAGEVLRQEGFVKLIKKVLSKLTRM